VEIIGGRGLTISKASELLGIKRPTLSNIMKGKASITPNIALRLETVFGGTARFWVRLHPRRIFMSLKSTSWKILPK
jgi:addiction module HigA family antidote